MLKVIIFVVSWMLILVFMPSFKGLIDVACDNTTGVLTLMHVDTTTITTLSALPWLIPIAYFIGGVWYLIGSQTQSQQPTYYQPEIKPIKPRKSKKNEW